MIYYKCWKHEVIS